MQNLPASSTSQNLTTDTLQHTIESLNATNKSLQIKFDLLRSLFDAMKVDFDSLRENFDAWNDNFESLQYLIDATNDKVDSTGVLIESTTDKVDASRPIVEPAKAKAEIQQVIVTVARESICLTFGQDDIPSRLADEMLLFLKSANISPEQFRQGLGASRSTIQRDMSILKKLGWITFHGSRNNGYFTLTEKGMEVLKKPV